MVLGFGGAHRPGFALAKCADSRRISSDGQGRPAPLELVHRPRRVPKRAERPVFGPRAGGADGPVCSQAREQAMGRFAGRASSTVKKVLRVFLFFRSFLTDMLMFFIRICSLFNIASTCILFRELKCTIIFLNIE